MAKHKFEGGMTTGTANDAPEGYSYCVYCGVDATDDNRDEECEPYEPEGVPGPILPPYEG